MNLHFEQHPKIIDFKPKNILIFLHGYGSNGKDLITLAPDLAKHLPDTLFISPNAPFNYEGGMNNAYQWYSLVDRSPKSIIDGFNIALPVLKKFINDQLEKYDLTVNDLILAGFSQGGMMTLQTVLNWDTPIKAAICLSGYIIDFEDSLKDIQTQTPILLVHGDMDTVVTFNTYQLTLQILKKLNLNVESYVSHGLGHGIDDHCIERSLSFLKKLISN